MVSGVSSTSAPAQIDQAHSAPPAPPKPAAQQTTQPQDTVHLSAAAKKAASGDADHDGDSK
jgi:hypothetical protein